MRGSGMHREALRVAHQRKAARENAAIGQRRQQLSAVSDPRLLALHQDRQRPPRPLGQSQRALAVARDGLALRLRVGELRGLEPDLKPGEAIAAPAQQRARADCSAVRR